MRKRKMSCALSRCFIERWQKNSKLAGCSNAVFFPWTFLISPVAINQLAHGNRTGMAVLDALQSATAANGMASTLPP